jgi:subtilisin family serine protease
MIVFVVGFAALAAAQDTRYIVKFRDGRGPAGQGALRAAGAQVVLSLDEQNAAAAHIPAAALNGLSRNPNIEYIEPDVIREPYATWANSSAGGEVLPYGIQMVQADRVSSPNPGAVTLCIIDSGYSQQHVDLKDGVGFTTTSGTGTWNRDSCGHGSHVAGTIAAISGNAAGVVGANPGVSLHIVKVFGNDSLVEDGSCSWTYSSTLVAALNSCRNAGADVVSMSLGGGARSRTEENAFNSADKAGVLSIAAAGNAGNNTTSYPAGYASVMSVAAVDANEAKASFSQANRDVEIAAPGVSVLSTTPWLDDNTLAAAGTTWSGGRIEGAARGSVSGALVNGGRCTSSSAAWAGKVVLCERGDISFADKVSNVQAGGGVAAAVYNLAASDPTCGVYSGTLGTGVTSPVRAITLSCSDGSAAVAAAGANGTVSSAFLAPNSGYEAWDGTSMATPHVSAVAALVWSCNLNKTNEQVRNALTASARDKGTAGRDNSYGYGIVQAVGAVQALGMGSCTITPAKP